MKFIEPHLPIEAGEHNMHTDSEELPDSVSFDDGRPVDYNCCCCVCVCVCVCETELCVCVFRVGWLQWVCVAEKTILTGFSKLDVW